MYKRDDYIEEIQPGMRGYGKYKYRVMDRDKIYPTHHTNSLADAQKWSETCIKYWLEKDALAEN